VAGFTIVSRGEVPGKRRPVIREQQQNDCDDDDRHHDHDNLRTSVLFALELVICQLPHNYAHSSYMRVTLG
jgi:hypothetical protein